MKTRNKTFGAPPVEIGEFKIEPDEMYFYQYLPIKLGGMLGGLTIPAQLHRIYGLIKEACNDYARSVGLLEYKETYVYVTAKCLYVTQEQNLNRDGWHSDGFGTEDINYIWSDCVPTNYVLGEWKDVPEDDTEALDYFYKLGFQATWGKIEIYETKNNHLYRLDETVIHACGNHHGKPRLRHFVKISFSKDKYNLKGNSHNYELDYKWDMVERGLNRNHPIKK